MKTEWLLGKEIVDCIAAKMRRNGFVEMGAQSVVVSMGSEGFVFSAQEWGRRVIT